LFIVDRPSSIVDRLELGRRRPGLALQDPVTLDAGRWTLDDS
jgi:hypothetical protein